jgi:hypothetical protein
MKFIPQLTVVTSTGTQRRKRTKKRVTRDKEAGNGKQSFPIHAYKLICEVSHMLVSI